MLYCTNFVEIKHRCLELVENDAATVAVNTPTTECPVNEPAVPGVGNHHMLVSTSYIASESYGTFEETDTELGLQGDLHFPPRSEGERVNTSGIVTEGVKVTDDTSGKVVSVAILHKVGAHIVGDAGKFTSEIGGFFCNGGSDSYFRSICGGGCRHKKEQSKKANDRTQLGNLEE